MNSWFFSTQIFNSLTWTSWSADSNWGCIIKKNWTLFLKPNFKWMKSMKDYLNYYNNWERRWKIRLKNKLDRLSKSLLEKYWYIIDPIKYLLFLYYHEWLSIENIHLRIKTMWFNYSDSNWLLICFKTTFWWELWNRSWSLISSRIRRANWQIIEAKKVEKEENDLKYEILRLFIWKRISKIIWTEFDYNYYNSLINKTQKILYLSWLFLWINEKDIKLFNNNFFIWKRIIANHLNIEIIRFLKKHEIDIIFNPISHSDITRIKIVSS